MQAKSRRGRINTDAGKRLKTRQTDADGVVMVCADWASAARVAEVADHSPRVSSDVWRARRE
jgi:tellurite resistance protein